MSQATQGPIRLSHVREGMTSSWLAAIPRYDALDRKDLRTFSPPEPAVAEPALSCAETALVFSGFRLESEGSLLRGNTVVHLPPRELAALRILLAHAGQIVTPSHLKKALWGDVHVTADSVPKCISSLRARLEPEDCIQTVYKRGYRLAGEVRLHQAPPSNLLPRLAITPFTTDIGVPEHLGFAIAEEAITRMSNARRPLASMLARDSVFALAQRGLTAHQVGEALHADLVLAGTLRAFTSHFRLRVEMIRSADGVQIWVEDLLVERERLAELEPELVARLAFRLRPGPLDSFDVAAEHQEEQRSTPMRQQSGADSEPGSSLAISAVAMAEPEDLIDPQRREAYEIFLRGHHEWQSLERHRMQDGMQQLVRATELDPSLMPAKVDLIQLCVTQAFYGYMSPLLAADLIRRTADSISGSAHQAATILPALGWVRFNVEHNLPAALWAFDQSRNLPHNAYNIREHVMFALSRHRFEEAAALNDEAMARDPFAPWLHARKAWISHLSGQADESVVQAQHALDLFPDHDGVALYASMVLAFNGSADLGVKIADALSRRQPQVDLVVAVHGYTLACAGRTVEARATLQRLQWLSQERFVLKSFTPAVCVALGDLEAAVHHLQAAHQDRCPWFFQMLGDPRLKGLHGNPAFEELRAILPRMEEAVRSGEEGHAGPASRV
jgi:DNA-binding winged helix-turn-helix (wHTH) protein